MGRACWWLPEEAKKRRARDNEKGHWVTKKTRQKAKEVRIQERKIKNERKSSKAIIDTT